MSSSSLQESASRLVRPELEIFRNSQKESDALQALRRILSLLEHQKDVLITIGNDGARVISRTIIESSHNVSNTKVFRVAQKVCSYQFIYLDKYLITVFLIQNPCLFYRL